MAIGLDFYPMYGGMKQTEILVTGRDNISIRYWYALSMGHWRSYETLNIG